MTYRITQWNERYEVDERGHEWQPGKAKRRGPLAFIRLKVHGRSQGVGWRKLLKRAGKSRALQVFGLFCKLLEIAGDAKRDERGAFATDGHEHPAFVLSVPSKQVEFGLEVLADIGWIELSPGKSGESRKSPANTTQPNTTNIYCPNSDEFRLAALLFELICARKPDYRKPNLQTWAKHVDYLIRLDKRTPPRVEAVIRWCQQDAFWQNNILSTDKLRKQFDRLEMQMQKAGVIQKTKKPKPMCACGCGRPGADNVSHQWFASKACRVKVLGW